MRAAHFLNYLNSFLEKGVEEEEDDAIIHNSTRTKAVQRVVGGAANRTARINPIKLLRVFAVTLCHLSKRSVSHLEHTLMLSTATLTDLDLSFTYIGFTGADMLRRGKVWYSVV
jgi:hypothetical protein